jgi:hypothetical protein
MKTKQEVKDEILELDRANEVSREVLNLLHAQSMERMQRVMALNHMLKEMDDEEKNVGSQI